VAAEEEAAGSYFLQSCERVLEAGAIAGGVAGSGRAEGLRLAIRQIDAEHRDAGAAENFSESDEQRSVGVRAGAVSEDEAVAAGSLGEMKEAADFGIDGVVDELANGGLRQGPILNRHEIAH
jgi:hypothetical protein